MTPQPKRPSPPPAPMVAVRTPSGQLVGYLDRARLVLQVKPRGKQAIEEVDLRPLIDNIQ